MEVKDPGHLYSLDWLDEVSGWAEGEGELRFVKRIGENYPGNEEPGYSGTQTQEVLRALIDRTNYVDNQKPHVSNQEVLTNLRRSLYALELRAAEIRKEDLEKWVAVVKPKLSRIERVTTCDWCGHIQCTRSHDVGHVSGQVQNDG
jgi:hypothetical protein